MNATPMHLNPVNAIPAQAKAGTSADAGTSETPFNQVLSNEMSQQRASSEASERTDSPAPTDSAPQTRGKAETAEETADALAHDMQALEQALALPQSPTPAENPAAVLALATSPDLLKQVVTPAQAGSALAEDREAPAATAIQADSTLGENPEALVSTPFPDIDPRRGPGAAMNPAEPRIKQGSSVQKADASQSITASPMGAPAAALSGQRAAERQSDTARTADALSDIMSNPALRPVPNAPLDTLPRPDQAAAARLSPSVGSTAWGQALGERIVWMAAGSQQTASLTLNPPHLGPLQVVLNVSNDQASASFFSAQPEVRQALEAALPRLREMMNDAGIELGQATVSADTPRQHDNAERQAQALPSRFIGDRDSAGNESLPPAHSTPVHSGRGLIDTFA